MKNFRSIRIILQALFIALFFFAGSMNLSADTVNWELECMAQCDCGRYGDSCCGWAYFGDNSCACWEIVVYG